MTDSRRLLDEYITNASEPAFRELTARYMNLVYSTAVRLMNGDTHGAEDVLQTVFIDLARLARTLSPGVMLGGWLHRRTCHVVANQLRSERRRQNRERQAAQMNAVQVSEEPPLEQIAPIIDDAINHLKAADRAAIILRFFETRDLRSIGAALGTSEDAAQKRVSRALEKLRVLLKRRGVTASAPLLAGVLSAQGAAMAPLALATSVSAAALTQASQSGGLNLVFLKLMAMSKLKVAATIVAVATAGTVAVFETHSWAGLRAEHRALEQQIASFREPAKQTPFDSPVSVQRASSLDNGQLAELENLRAEIAMLRRQSDATARLRAENAQLRRLAPQASADPIKSEFDRETQHRMQDLKKWGLMFRIYSDRHNGQFPDTWDQVAENIPARERPAFLQFARENFEITYHGTDEAMSNRVDAILFRERQPRMSPEGKLIKTYGLLDGSARVLSQPGVNFETFERENIIPAR